MLTFDNTSDDDSFSRRIVKMHPTEKYTITVESARYKNDHQNEVVCLFHTSESEVIMRFNDFIRIFPDAKDDKIFGSYRGRARSVLYLGKGIRHSSDLERSVIDYRKYGSSDVLQIIKIYKDGEFVGILDNDPWLACINGKPLKQENPITTFVGYEHKE